jgi:hypothetical protein
MLRRKEVACEPKKLEAPGLYFALFRAAVTGVDLTQGVALGWNILAFQARALGLSLCTSLLRNLFPQLS